MHEVLLRQLKIKDDNFISFQLKLHVFSFFQNGFLDALNNLPRNENYNGLSSACKNFAPEVLTQTRL